MYKIYAKANKNYAEEYRFYIHKDRHANWLGEKLKERYVESNPKGPKLSRQLLQLPL